MLINAGRAGDAWSGGDIFKDPSLLVCIREWVFKGETFIGINQPAATEGGDTFYRLADLLGVDEDTGARVCHGKWGFLTEDPEGLVPEGCTLPVRDSRFLTDGKAQVLLSHDGYPDLTRYSFGKGTSFYLSGYSYSPENSRLLLNLMAAGTGKKCEDLLFISENPMIDCAYFPDSDAIVLANLTEREQKTRIRTEQGFAEATVPGAGQIIINAAKI